MTNKDKRDFYVEHLRRQLIGTGADVFGVDNNEELIASFPLQVYYSAILFPERETGSAGNLGDNNAKNNIDDFGSQNETDNESQDVETPPESPVSNTTEPKKNKKDSKDTYKSVNSYFPNNCGLTFCVDENVNQISATFRAGRYKQTKSHDDIKIEIRKDDYHQLINLPDFPFTDNLKVEEKNKDHYFLQLSKALGKTNSEVKQKIRNYKSDLIAKDRKHDTYIIGFKKLDLLTSGVVFKRQALQKEIKLDLSNAVISIFDDGNVNAKCYVKVISKGGKKYVKLLLKNNAEKHPLNKFSYANEKLNEKSLFQVGIEVNAPIKPYKDEIIENIYDHEATIINYQYREQKSYGIGHGTAVEWDKNENPQWIKTTYLPQIAVRNVSNNFRDNEKHLEEIAKIKNLSIWTEWQPDELCDKLEQFIGAYQNWINKQQKQVQKEDTKYGEYGNEIIRKQRKNYDRLKRNIETLRNNPQAYDTFLLANTAMYIQLIISIDDKYSKREKELIEFSNAKDEDYKSLKTFENYKTPKDRPIAYRPFQLAFLLMSIEGIIDKNTPDRNDVDLLWFPTGGGKTEAYLAVTAFTILWRRKTNPNSFEGVSVIMRYTLRLLTAQQFERASRLIVALEFLNRRQGELHTKALHEKPNIGNAKKTISIGMWVGGATTPNRIEDAHSELNGSDETQLNRQIQKLNNSEQIPDNADSVDNVFQVSSCAWCGCKTITKNPQKDKFVHAFRISKGKFTIECKNTKCDFNNSLPIDVVDDSLYENPPTLLFATIDKFAQLSHREEGHRFFNSLNDEKLPPDLIIQDELHLLNGALGSIAGLFELIVERLCTKGNHKPKIIASTATTRNTEKQVGNLYRRKVNVFPPLGITYDDNYFSFTDKKNESKRLHVGFMPTGKTSVDSQVRALLPQLLFARILLYKTLKLQDNEINNHWTIVSYYNSLKDVGKTYNKVNDEIVSELKRLHKRNDLDRLQYNFNNSWLMSKTRELTSRIESTKIKSYLNELDTAFKTIRENQDDFRKEKNYAVSLVLASNMLSVGIDVSRLNVMLMNGQPKNIAEYIQASSRVAREFEGLVVNLLDANRAREKSYFENYLPFHNAYYKFVEPLTVTPFTFITSEKVLNSLFVCFVRHIEGLYRNKDAHKFEEKCSENFISFMREYLPNNKFEDLDIEEDIKDLSEKWIGKIETKNLLSEELTYKNGLIEKSQELISTDELSFALMNSMREIDTDSVIDINIYKNLNKTT